MDEKLEQVLHKVELLCEKYPEFDAALREKHGANATLIESSNDKLDEIYEYCIERVVKKQAEEYYEQAVKLGYYKSIFHLAELYHGWNERKSLKYYLEYLSKGDQTIYEYVQSCLVVGRKYYDGEGTNIDKEKAFTYWKKGAELGEARCLHRIEKYFKGRLTDSELRQLNKGLEGRLLI